MKNLQEYGWNEYFENQFLTYSNKSGYSPARITKESKNQFWIMTEDGEKKAIMSTKFFMNIFQQEDLPTVGDFVVVKQEENMEKYLIEGLLKRKSALTRKGKDTYGRNFSKEGSSELRIISANIDTVFYVISLDHRDFNLTKIERYLAMFFDTEIEPVLILNKKDICPDYNGYVDKLKKISKNLPIYSVSAIDNDGIDELQKYIKPGKTIAFIGASGVGKSSITNCLLGIDAMYVSNVREDDKRGKHTTTHREMLVLPKGGILIDNPGIRDFKPVISIDALNYTFEDIIELEIGCKFSNCTHSSEPGCKIIEAIESGELDIKRYNNYLKMKREAHHYERRAAMRENYIEKAILNEKKGGKKIKKHMKGKKRRDSMHYE